MEPQRTQGQDARSVNIKVTNAISNAVKSTLGPKGMDKMIASEDGDATISNDGATILKNMKIEHPIGKMLVDIAKTQESEVGDGTTTAVILTGSLLDKANQLIQSGVHPSTIINGYKLADKKARELYSLYSNDINIDEKDKLKNIIKTTMSGKLTDSNEYIIDLILRAFDLTYKDNFSRDNIKVSHKIGKSIEESELTTLFIDKPLEKPITTSLIKPTVLLIDASLEQKTPEDVSINISDPDKYTSFIEQEEKHLEEMANKIIKTGVDIVFCQKGVDDIVTEILAKNNIVIVKRVLKEDMNLLGKITNTLVNSTLNNLAVGELDSVKQESINGEDVIFVTKDTSIVNILLRASTDHILQELERAVDDVIGSLISVLNTGKYVYGAGATEMKVSLDLKEYSKELGGKEQLAIDSYADALLSIPETLADSTGENRLDIITEMKHQHNKGIFAGIDVIANKVVDMTNSDVIEPLDIKLQALKSATESSIMILRIDDIVIGKIIE